MTSRSHRAKTASPGVFITFEGGERSGKSTHLKLLAEHLYQLGYPVLTTREPGGTALGATLRQALLFSKNIQPQSEALLFAADRAEHVATVIRPALEAGKVVLCDRYIDSSVAYQGGGYGLGLDKIWQLNGWATQGLLPALTFLLLQTARTEPPTDEIEARPAAFFAAVHDAYRALAKRSPGRIVSIWTHDPVQTVQHQIRQRVLRLLEHRHVAQTERPVLVSRPPTAGGQ